MALSVSLAMSFGLELKQDLHDLPEGGQLWALLVAGSKGFMNYRHQADICHAYQVGIWVVYHNSMSKNESADAFRLFTPMVFPKKTSLS